MISFHLLLLVWYLRLRQLTSLETCLHIPNVLLIGPWLSMSNLRHYFFGVFELVTVPGLRRRIEISAFTLGKCCTPKHVSATT
jgi:hypothetical protein